MRRQLWLVVPLPAGSGTTRFGEALAASGDDLYVATVVATPSVSAQLLLQKLRPISPKTP